MFQSLLRCGNPLVGKSTAHRILVSKRQLSFSQKMSSSDNTITSHEMILDGRKIFYEKAGNGTHNTLLLPGAVGSTRTDFSPQLLNMDGNKLCLYSWDPAGYGKSRPPNRTWPDKFFDQDAADVAALVKEIGLDKVSLVGWSDGGITALVVAVMYPDIVDKLVLFGTNSYVTKEDVDALEKIRNLDKWSERMRKPFEDMYGAEYFKVLWNGWVDAYRSYYDKYDGDIVRDRICEIRNPTLIIHGQLDPLVPQEHADYLHSKIAGSKLVNWPEAKHNLHLRYPEDFNKLVTDFLVSGV